jgi:hypothetical protein
MRMDYNLKKSIRYYINEVKKPFNKGDKYEI